MERRYTFIEFDKKTRRATTSEPMLTIQKSGLLSFNAAAARLFGNATHVKLLYDSGGQALAFKPCESGSTNAYALRPQRGSRGRMVSGKGFLAHIGIKYGTEVVRVKLEQDNELLIANLSGLEMQDSRQADSDAKQPLLEQ